MGRVKTTGLRIMQYPHPALRQVGESIEAIDEDIKALAKQMLELMHQAKGVGLAAPQVDSCVRLFVCNPTGNEWDDHVYVNPGLLEASGAEEREEGCLSIPNVTVTMRRATNVVIEALDLEGRVVRRPASDLEARVVQHELDHLDGRLIIDNMSATDEMANRKALKKLEEEFRNAKRL